MYVGVKFDPRLGLFTKCNKFDSNKTKLSQYDFIINNITDLNPKKEIQQTKSHYLCKCCYYMSAAASEYTPASYVNFMTND